MPDAIPRDFLPCPFCGGRASIWEGFKAPYIQCDECGALAEPEWWNKRTHRSSDKQEAANAEIRASRIGGEYDLERGDPLAVIRDEWGVLRPVGTLTRLQNVAVMDGSHRRIERDVLVLEPKHA